MRSRERRIRMVPLVVGVFLAVIGSAFVVSAETGEVATTSSTAIDDSTTGDPGVVLYYFHGTRRCKTCRSIEAYTQEALERKFGDELHAGALRWEVVNTDEPANAHFVKDFSLVSSSLVLVETDGSTVVRHEVLQEAWTLVRDESRFMQYVQRSVHGYLK
jgi:hypothetical protein